MIDRLRRHAGVALVTSGLVGVLVGGGAYVHAWYVGWAWAYSDQADQAERAERQAESSAPIWIDAEETSVSPPDDSTPTPNLRSTPGAAAEAPGDLAAASTGAAAPAPAPPEAPRRAAAGEIELAEVDFRFLDPPEPGAHARLALALRSRAEAPSGTISLAIASKWLTGFEVFGAIPDVITDRTEEDGHRYFDFPGLPPGGAAELELHFTARDEDVDAPEVRVGLRDGDEIGRARPRTVAPRPRPGPARTVDIPRLGIRAGVVPTEWEPPPFVIGQIRGSPHVSEGNTVLIGHLGGPAGDVFARLDRARPGDEVVAISRGLEYRFVVSEISVRPFDDSSPMLPTDTPRLTLMTCTGRWNPFTNDYSHRIWVVAEPPELAQATIAANAERAERMAREAEQAAAERAAHEAAVAATATAQAVAEQASVQAGVGQAVAAAPTPTATPASTTPPEPPPAHARATPTPRAGPEPIGLEIRAPTAMGRVPSRVAVRGVRTGPGRSDAHPWLLVRAQIEGSRWYVYGQELEVRPDGSWEIELELGGPPNVRHELRVGAADPAAHAELLRHVAERPGQPLQELPAGFRREASVVVVRQ